MESSKTLSLNIFNVTFPKIKNFFFRGLGLLADDEVSLDYSNLTENPILVNGQASPNSAFVGWSKKLTSTNYYFSIQKILFRRNNRFPFRVLLCKKF